MRIMVPNNWEAWEDFCNIVYFSLLEFFGWSPWMEIADKSKKIREFKLGKKKKVSEGSGYLFSTFFFFLQKNKKF